MITMQEVRRKFPSPVSSKQGWRPGGVKPGMYCTGGAFMAARQGMTLGSSFSIWFPTTRELATHLEDANPALSTDAADLLAEQLIVANDEEDFNEAWHILDIALSTTGDAT